MSFQIGMLGTKCSVLSRQIMKKCSKFANTNPAIIGQVHTVKDCGSDMEGNFTWVTLR